MARKSEGGAVEKRSYTAEYRSEAGGGKAVVFGRPVIYGAEARLTDRFGDAYVEVIAPGALDGTDMRDVRLLVNHEGGSLPLARSRNNNGSSTMTLFVDGEGLYFTAELDTANNAEARALASAVGRGDLSGMSLGFTITAESWDLTAGGEPRRTIGAIGSLIEVSAVTFPAYGQTQISVRDNRPQPDGAALGQEAAPEGAAPPAPVPEGAGAGGGREPEGDPASGLALEKSKIAALYGRGGD